MFHRGIDNMGVKLLGLDTDKKYGYFDKDEVFWRFSFEKVGDESSWFAHRTKPGEKPLFIGKIPEEEIIKRLKSNPKPLTQDDYIDLELWLAHGGLGVEKKKK